tara:strand:+ start:11247 stop:11987 length:741 start_codon:yes stop_codon:yes gene_type:complete
MNQELLDALKECEQDSMIEVWIPSKESLISFKSINIDQQKSVMELIAADGEEFLLELKAFDKITSIIKENSVESLKDINIIDRAVILWQLRADINNKYIFNNEDGLEITANLDATLETLKTIKTPGGKSIEVKKIKIKLEYPSVEKNKSIDSKIIKLIETELVDAEPITIGISIIEYELCKYISSLTAGTYCADDEDEIISIISKLPAEVITEINLYITESDKVLEPLYNTNGVEFAPNSSFFVSI